MAIIPQNKQWKQPNDGDSLGNIFASYGLDLDKNRGAVAVSNRLKNVFDEGADSDLSSPAARFIDFNSDFWAISSELFRTDAFADDDITNTNNWAQDSTGSSPDPGATVTDAVVFDGLLLVVDGDDIKSFSGSGNWVSWWKGTRGQTGLDTGQTFILTVGSNRSLYITDGGNKVYRVQPNGSGGGTISKTGGGTLDFSATSQLFTCATTTSTRIFYGMEDTAAQNAYIVEWDMSAQSTTPNRIHKMGVKRVLCLATYNDSPIAILSDGSIKYYNGAAFISWPGAHLPQSKDDYQNDIIHKNGWDIIDGLPHFLIKPTVDINENTITEDTSNYWYYPAGIYCLDPEIGLYCRYPLTDDAATHYNVANVGALHARNHANTKFFASYEVWTSTTTRKNIIACEDRNNSLGTQAWMMLIPFESVRDVIHRLTVVHKQLGTGDSIKLYYARNNPNSVRVSGSWYDANTFNTTDSITGVTTSDYGFIKAGASGYFFSKIENIDISSTVNSITFADSSGASQNDTAVLELVSLRYMGQITNTGTEIDDFAIPNPKRSRQVWVFIEMQQAAGNDLQLDYLLTE